MTKYRPNREARVVNQLERSIRQLNHASVRFHRDASGDREQLAVEKHRAAQKYELALDRFREFLMPRQASLFDMTSVNEGQEI